MQFFKRKEEKLEQVAHDGYYQRDCPVCKTHCQTKIHQLQSKEERVPEFLDSVVTECPECHVAVYVELKNVVRTLQTYVRDRDALFGMRLISSEVLK